MVIGREEEIKEMNLLLERQESDLLLVTGRRRVGKSYLIQEMYRDHLVFKFVGTRAGANEIQLEKFSRQLSEHSAHKMPLKTPLNWHEAFENLKKYILGLRKSKKKKVIFLDEFPWIDQPNSNFIQEFGYWWNSWAAWANILVVICGSSTAWMNRKIANNTGELYNRVTRKIHLHPFSLAETKKLLRYNKIQLADYDILQLYMCMGGIPMYLQQIRPDESAVQAVHRICFTKSGILYQEFNELFISLFTNYENHIAVVNALSKKWSGLTRDEILKWSKLTDGGSFNTVLDDLLQSDFILAIHPLLNAKKGTLYRLSDEYCRFYIHFIQKAPYSKIKEWISFQSSSAIYKAWQGYAFETICIKHVAAIKKCLGISGILSSVHSFYSKGKKDIPGTQIDMLIDRNDGVINLCEVKFYNEPLKALPSLIQSMRSKKNIFHSLTNTKKAIFNTVISTFGIDKELMTSSDVQSHVDMKCLFEDIRL